MLIYIMDKFIPAKYNFVFLNDNLCYIVPREIAVEAFKNARYKEAKLYQTTKAKYGIEFKNNPDIYIPFMKEYESYMDEYREIIRKNAVKVSDKHLRKNNQ